MACNGFPWSPNREIARFGNPFRMPNLAIFCPSFRQKDFLLNGNAVFHNFLHRLLKLRILTAIKSCLHFAQIVRRTFQAGGMMSVTSSSLIRMGDKVGKIACSCWNI